MLRRFCLSSQLQIPANELWALQSLASVNLELQPWYRMTAPSEILHAPLDYWHQHKQLLNSWILLVGLIPVDRHDFGTIRITGPMTLVETSSSLFNRYWQHQRQIRQHEGYTEVVDQVEFEPRFRVLAAWQQHLYRAAFQHRHSQLQQHYGAFIAI